MRHEKRLTLNAKKMTTRERAHAHIKERLRLPDWYGNNLDALNDCLGEIGEPTRIVVHFAPALEETPGEYGDRIIRVLEQVAQGNKNLTNVQRDWF